MKLFYAAHEAVFSLYKEAILTVQDNRKVFGKKFGKYRSESPLTSRGSLIRAPNTVKGVIPMG